jgi:hypothetical protein
VIAKSVARTFGIRDLPRARFAVSGFRVRVVLLMTLIASLLFLLAIEAALFWPNNIGRIAFPWADNEWADGPTLHQLHRMELGGPGYASPLGSDSMDYGAVYLFALFFLRRLLGLPFSIVSYRSISIGLGLLSIVPFSICALLIARSAGLRRLAPLPTLLILGTTALLTVAVSARSITFASTHPDTLLAFFVALSLAIYYAIATRVLDPRVVWVLVVTGILTAFTKQNSFIMLPILVVGLALSRAISWRVAVAAAGAYVGIVVLLLAVMPEDMRAWMFFIPEAHPYEFLVASRVLDFFAYLTHWEYYISLELAIYAIVTIMIARRVGRQAYATHFAPGFAIVLVAMQAYFKTFGVWNNLTIIGLFCIPYCATLVWLLASPRFVKRAHMGILAASTALLLLVANGLHEATQPWVPGAKIQGEMRIVSDAMRNLCARGKPILVLVLPDMFFDCPTAKYALTLSYGEEALARRRFDPGLFVWDRPTTYPYIVDMWGWPLTRRWQRYYRLEKEYPAVFGFGNYYYPMNVRVWALKRTPGITGAPSR